MTATIRAANAGDAAACGNVMYEAFNSAAERHGFAPDFPNPAAAVEFAAVLTSHPAIFGVVAQLEGKVVGSNFLWERDPIRGLGPIAIDPRYQGAGIGRALMQAVLDRAVDAAGVRLVQEPQNTASVALYASLGFVVREPLVLLQGKPQDKPVAARPVRPAVESDVSACAALCERILGFARGGELREALRFFNPFVVEREGRISGYLTAATFWPANHGVAETDEDMHALILGAAAACAEPVAFILPVRQSALFRWCLAQRLRLVKPWTLMTLGAYRPPSGTYFLSALY